MRTKEDIYRDLDLIVAAGHRPHADFDVLFWRGKQYVDELYKAHKENLLMKFVKASLKWSCDKKKEKFGAFV